MKKKIAITILLAAVALGGCGASKQAVSYIGADKAKVMALESTGLTADIVENISADLKNRDGRDYYQIKYLVNGEESVVDVDALTGVVLSNANNNLAIESQVTAEEMLGENAASTGNQNQKSNQGTVSRTMIDKDAAKNKALTHAGVSSDNVTFVIAKLDWENGKQVYEVEFYSQDGVEYDYEIDAYTGDVLAYDHEVENWNGPNQAQVARQEKAQAETAAKAEAEAQAAAEAEAQRQAQAAAEAEAQRQAQAAAQAEAQRQAQAAAQAEAQRQAQAAAQAQAQKTQSQSNGLIGDARAKELALSRVPGASSANIVEFHLDYDDGRQEYEGTIIYNNMEYEFEIDAYSGNFRGWDVESVWD